MPDQMVVVGSEAILPDGRLLVNLHPPRRCHGQTCVIHNPSSHHMRDWPIDWREDVHTFERICPHGIAHPDPDGRKYPLLATVVHQKADDCDGCCVIKEIE